MFTLPTGGSATVDGVAVTAVGPTISLAAIPLVTAQSSTALRSRSSRVVSRSIPGSSRARRRGRQPLLSHDKLPDAAPVDLTDYLPFLSLG